VNEAKGKVARWTWQTRIAESGGVGVTIYEVHVYGWRGKEAQKLPNARTARNVRIEALGEAFLDSHIRHTRHQNTNDDGKLVCIYYGIDDNGHYVSAKLPIEVVSAKEGGPALRY